MRFTPLFASSMSGSLGGLTAAKGPRGHRLYGKRVKVRSDSRFQRAARQAFSFVKQGWFTDATEEDRDFWAQHGQTLVVPDRLGIARPLSGRAAYTAFDFNFLYSSQLGLNSFTPFPAGRPPAGYAPPIALKNPLLRLANLQPQFLDWAFDITNADQFGGLGDYFIYASAPRPRPDSGTRKGYILAGENIFSSNGPSSIVFGTAMTVSWHDKYGPPRVGDWVGIKLVCYDGNLRFSRPHEYGPYQIQP